MEVKTINDVLRFHEEFVKKVKEQAKIVRSPEGLSPKALVKEKKQLLKRFEDKLKIVTKAKIEAEKRYDKEIKDIEDMILHLK